MKFILKIFMKTLKSKLDVKIVLIKKLCHTNYEPTHPNFDHTHSHL